jgi:hypothetical protein
MFGALNRNTFGKLDPRRLVTIAKEMPNADKGGNLYLLGNFALFALGGLSGDYYKLAGSVGLTVAASMFGRSGKRPNLFAAASTVCIPSIISTNWSGIQAGDPWTLAGTGLFVIGYASGALSGPLAKAFENTKTALLKHTLGMPRRMMGVLSALSKGPLIWGAITRHEMGFLGILITWCVGDYFMAKSKPDLSDRPKNSFTNPFQRPALHSR